MQIHDNIPNAPSPDLQAVYRMHAELCKALANEHRQAILHAIGDGEKCVSDLAAEIGISVHNVSQHLRVLKDVGLVHVRRDGRRMLYRTNAEAIRPLHEWTETFERFWRHQLQRIKERAESKTLPVPDSVQNPKEKP